MSPGELSGLLSAVRTHMRTNDVKKGLRSHPAEGQCVLDGTDRNLGTLLADSAWAKHPPQL